MRVSARSNSTPNIRILGDECMFVYLQVRLECAIITLVAIGILSCTGVSLGKRRDFKAWEANPSGGDRRTVPGLQAEAPDRKRIGGRGYAEIDIRQTG